jgi:hypothetical protein
MDIGNAETRRLIEGEEPLEGTLVDLIVAVSESSEDESEIFERMDDLLVDARTELTLQSCSSNPPTFRGFAQEQPYAIRWSQTTD